MLFVFLTALKNENKIFLSTYQTVFAWVAEGKDYINYIFDLSFFI